MNGPAFPRVPILSATLGEDDVAIARMWLDKPVSEWNDLTLVTQWEEAFAAWLGADTATAWLGGRASLYMGILALGLQKGEAVILPAFTCQCVVNAFIFHGIEIVYADIEDQSYGLDIASVRNVITPNTKAILLQYTFGLVSRDIEQLLDFGRQNNLFIIEDCAHALGATWQGKRLGTLGDIAIFSSERSKIINTIHGGIVSTQHPEIGQRLRRLAAHAGSPSNEKTTQLLNTVIQNYYLYVSPDQTTVENQSKTFDPQQVLPQMFPEEFESQFIPHYTERINAPVAALALNQFVKMPSFHQCRLQAANYWQKWCLQRGYQPPLILADSEPVFLRYPVCAPDIAKNNLQALEDELNVTVGVWFSSAAHPLPLVLDHCPVGERVAKTCINLPTILPAEYFKR